MIKLSLKLWRSRSIALTVLSIFLGSFFVLMGFLKLSPWLNSEIHRELRRNFIHFSKLIPILTRTGYKVPPKIYRILWGGLELINGSILILVPFRRAKIISNFILLFISMMSIYNHYQAGHKFDRIAPCIVFTLMLACRLIVEYQVHRRENMQKQMQLKTSLDYHGTLFNGGLATRGLNHNNNHIVLDDQEHFTDNNDNNNNNNNYEHAKED